MKSFSFTYLLVIYLCLLFSGCAANSAVKVGASGYEPRVYNPGEGYQLSWSDEFTNKTISKKNWNFEKLKAGHYNDEWQEYIESPETAYITNIGDGMLTIQANHKDKTLAAGHFVSARLNTKGKKHFLYGKIAARMKLPYGQGTWPAFWMLGEDFDGLGGNKSWPSCGEVDIMEFFGGWTLGDDKSLAAVHGPGYSGEYPDKDVYSLPFGKFNDGFHVFEIEWTSNQIVHSIDGQKFHTSTPADVEGKWVFNHPFFLILNFAVGGCGCNPDENTVFPQYLLVDWVRVYTNGNGMVR